MSQSDTLRGVMLALVANFIWGIAALYWLQTKPVDAFDVMAHRGLWTLPVTLIIVLLFGRLAETLRLLRSWRFICWVALSALMLTINWGVYVFAVTNERATEASLGYFMLPLLTIALGVFVFGERPKPVQLLAIGLAIVAVLLQLVALGSLPWVSLTLALSFSLYAAIRKQIAADSLQGLFLESLCMAPFAVVWLIVNDGAGLGMHGTRVDLFLLLGGGVYGSAVTDLRCSDPCLSAVHYRTADVCRSDVATHCSDLCAQRACDPNHRSDIWPRLAGCDCGELRCMAFLAQAPMILHQPILISAQSRLKTLRSRARRLILVR
ncbi:EamA family transporter RarD [Luminiphilus sp.]|nr:EamA family transporter RarD [Luminiphilus sp.]